MEQSILDRAVKIATKQAMSGYPVARIVWVQPMTAADDPGGSFIVDGCPPLTAADTPPWEG